MSSYPAVFTASPQDLGSAMRSVRAAVGGLPEGRIYAAAFVFAILTRNGTLTWWRDWNDPVPTPVATRVTRAQTEGALWAAFGFESAVVLRAGSPPLAALGHPERVMLEPFFDSQHPERITVLKYTAPGTSRSENSVKVSLDDAAWLWNDPGAPGPVAQAVEYNAVNSYNQQNGVRCALPARTALSLGQAAATYRRARPECDRYQAADNTCTINGRGCAADGDGGGRTSTKPRVLIPAAPGGDTWLLTPSAFEELITRARVSKTSGVALPLPKALDLAIIIGWAKQGSGVALDFGPLVNLLGPLLQTMTEP